jgi:hypothetical protein
VKVLHYLYARREVEGPAAAVPSAAAQTAGEGAVAVGNRRCVRLGFGIVEQTLNGHLLEIDFVVKVRKCCGGSGGCCMEGSGRRVTEQNGIFAQRARKHVRGERWDRGQIDAIRVVRCGLNASVSWTIDSAGHGSEGGNCVHEKGRGRGRIQE